MKFSVNWLKEWVKITESAEQLGEKLTNAGLEVEAVEPAAASFRKVVIGKVLRAEPHPDADKLRVCTVDSGSGELQIVCGAANARAGLLAPLAVVGAVLPGDFEINKARLRGIESNGMLCSGKELGLGEDADGLLELPADAPVGEDFREYLELDDTLIEIDLTPNRADCLSIRGIARDVSATCATDFIDHEVAPVAASIERQLEIALTAPAACPRYVGRVIEGIDPQAETPVWMIEKLRRSGIRSLGPLVDITNYVLLLLGQPMHAFDLDKLQGGIEVRMAKTDETLVLLDGSEITLNDDLLLIADDSGALALAGIMGGESTAINSDTRNIFLESAFFDPAVIMGKSRRFGLHTDSSHRFERGVDPGGQEEAIELATKLLLEICGGQPGPLTIAESGSHIPERKPVNLRLSRLNKVLGSELSATDVEPILQRLGFSLESAAGNWLVTPPGARFDITIEEDLIEEVARIYGYNNIPTRMPGGRIPTPHIPEREIPLNNISQALVANGYSEAINYSFIDLQLLNACAQGEAAYALANPLSADMDVLRTTLLPGLLVTLNNNQRRQRERIRMFELGNVFAATQAAPTQSLHLAAVASGTAITEQWAEQPRAMDFFDIKGDLERVIALRGLPDVEMVATQEHAWLHPGQAAQLRLNDKVIGWIGAIHPQTLKNFGIRSDVFAFELEVDVFQQRELPQAKEISRFPVIRRDLAIVVPENISFAAVKRVIRDSAGDLLADLRVFDVYQGEGVEKTYKSLAISLILQDVSSTLKDETADSLIIEVISALKVQFGAKLRGK